MSKINQGEIDSFLQEPRHAIVGTLGRDGAPQLSPVWYIYEEGRFYIGITSDTAKYRNLRRDPRISLCIDGGRADVRTVMVAGTAELYEKSHPLQVAMRWRLISHYIADTEEALRYAKSSQEWDAVLVVVTPQKIITQNFSA
ncbi:MAG: PPOX class F420-dependent oxidoreductase [Caldilineaceae bacterium]|nr:PPOX class F420-dependent oxidoreductase [Caldilineaceae bacterium]HRJ42757.1 PPOX class F420-dependent oxidoreductase [Caldilineaceae bacterium]